MLRETASVGFMDHLSTENNYAKAKDKKSPRKG